MATSAEGERGNDSPETENFECNICFDTATNAVVSMCGHLFCWPCIHTWMESKSHETPTCPVCKSVIDKEKLIPLYGRGSANQKDPRDSVPPRPAGQREEAPNNPNTGYFGDGMFNGINVSFGIGGFPFGFGLGPAFTIQTGRPHGQYHQNINIGSHGNRMNRPRGGQGRQDDEQRKTMARLLLTFAILFIIMIIFT